MKNPRYAWVATGRYAEHRLQPPPFPLSTELPSCHFERSNNARSRAFSQSRGPWRAVFARWGGKSRNLHLALKRGRRVLPSRPADSSRVILNRRVKNPCRAEVAGLSPSSSPLNSPAVISSEAKMRACEHSREVEKPAFRLQIFYQRRSSSLRAKVLLVEMEASHLLRQISCRSYRGRRTERASSPKKPHLTGADGA
jgi:hypothetical protein